MSEVDDGFLRKPGLYTAFVAAVETFTAPCCGIVSCGLLGAGKSTLLNALSGRFGQEYFATGAGRTTHVCKSLRGASVRWIDTPGLDVSGSDDAEAEKAILAADILLFVHDLGTGELHKEQFAFLSRVARGAETRHGLAERLCVALTRKDSQTREDLSRLKDTIQRQCKEAICGSPAIFPVDSKTYLKGARDAKPELIERSGMVPLRRHLEAVARDARGVSARRRKRIDNIEEEFRRQIDDEIGRLTKQRQARSREGTNVEKALRGDFTEFLTELYKRLADFH